MGFLKDKLKTECLKDNLDLYNFIEANVPKIDECSIDASLILNSFDIEDIKKENNDSLNIFINLNKINDFRRINAYLIEANKKLKQNGILVCNAETIQERRIRILKKHTYFSFTLFYPIDFVYKRAFPKLPVLKKIYFAISHGKNRVISKSEALGRLCYCGFELLKMKEIDNRLYFIVKKIKEPASDKNPSYGLLFKMKRIGKNGKPIYVYKIRTMHPYAEYIQDYIHDTHGLDKDGKIYNDFRITSWGKFIRKSWIDETPMLINLLKGDLKIFGVRPLSEAFFSHYPEDLKKMRIEHKPGFIPPYYVDLPTSIEDVWKSERKYLTESKKNPFKADMVYLARALYNVLILGAHRRKNKIKNNDKTNTH